MNARSRFATRCLIAVIIFIAGMAANAQSYPAKPLVFYVPFAAGSATDYLARALGQGVTVESKQNIVVDNRPGASGFIAAQAAAKAPADGYSVLIATNTTHAANEHLFKKLPYDPVHDFAPVTTLARGGQVMLVHPQVPAKSVKEFIALAKRQPGKLRALGVSSRQRNR
jgi:tripartite-type tricarboxylate transporter receptor subunit TctC